jgi:hypothetical protein
MHLSVRWIVRTIRYLLAMASNLVFVHIRLWCAMGRDIAATIWCLAIVNSGFSCCSYSTKRYCWYKFTVDACACLPGYILLSVTYIDHHIHPLLDMSFELCLISLSYLLFFMNNPIFDLNYLCCCTAHQIPLHYQLLFPMNLWRVLSTYVLWGTPPEISV